VNVAVLLWTPDSKNLVLTHKSHEAHVEAHLNEEFRNFLKPRLEQIRTEVTVLEKNIQTWSINKLLSTSIGNIQVMIRMDGNIFSWGKKGLLSGDNPETAWVEYSSRKRHSVA